MDDQHIHSLPGFHLHLGGGCNWNICWKKNHPLKSLGFVSCAPIWRLAHIVSFLGWLVLNHPSSHDFEASELKPLKVGCNGRRSGSDPASFFGAKGPIFSGANLLWALGRVTTKKDNWVVASQICSYFHPEIWGKVSISDEHIFSDGLVQPPTR